MPAAPASKPASKPPPAPFSSLLQIAKDRPFSWQGRLFWGGSFLLNAIIMIRAGHPDSAALPLLVGVIVLVAPVWQ